MCYTIEKNLTRAELEKRFGAKFKPNRPYSPGKRVSGFEHPDVPLIHAGNQSEITTGKWGLVPHWTKDNETAKQIMNKTLNARSETLREKASFKNLVKNKRCAVLTNGFYEWQHVGKQKVPFFLSLKDDFAMPMAGLYDSWIDQETGEVLSTFTIITTHANRIMEEIHNTKKRMPVILTEEGLHTWIKEEVSEKEIGEVLQPLPDELMLAENISDQNKKSNAGGAQQGTLF